LSPLLNKGTTYDSYGKTPESNDKFNKIASGFFTTSTIFFRIIGDIPSGPGSFCVSKATMSRSTKSANHRKIIAKEITFIFQKHINFSLKILFFLYNTYSKEKQIFS
jgi:hypothetical protein